MDSHALQRWMRTLNLRYRWVPAQERLYLCCSSMCSPTRVLVTAHSAITNHRFLGYGFHVLVHGLLHYGHLTCLMVIRS